MTKRKRDRRVKNKDRLQKNNEQTEIELSVEIENVEPSDFQETEEQQEKREITRRKEEEEIRDNLMKLPSSLQIRIFQFLSPRDLCACQFVCKSWASLSLANVLWWRHAMKVLWIAEERPTQVDKKLLNDKKNKGKWKGEFKNAVARLETPRPVVRKKKITLWVTETKTREEMRAEYKMIRSNPKGKKPIRDRNHKFEACYLEDSLF